MIVSFWGSLDLFKGGTENFQGVVMTILAPTFGPFSVLSKAQLRLFRQGTVLRPDSKSDWEGFESRMKHGGSSFCRHGIPVEKIIMKQTTWLNHLGVFFYFAGYF